MYKSNQRQLTFENYYLPFESKLRSDNRWVKQTHAKEYPRRFGYWPESVHADMIYRTLDNRRFCKKHGIRLSGPALGRLSKNAEVRRELKKQAYEDELKKNCK